MTSISCNAAHNITAGPPARRKREEALRVWTGTMFIVSKKWNTSELTPRSHRRKRDHSMSHYGLVHTSIPVPKSVKIPAAQAAVDREGGKLDNLLAWSGTKHLAKSDVIHKGSSAFRNGDWLVRPQELRVGRALAKIQRTSHASRRHCQRRHKMPSSLDWRRNIRISDDSGTSSWHCIQSAWHAWMMRMMR